MSTPGVDTKKGRALTCIAQPECGPARDVRVDEQISYKGLHIEHLSWPLPTMILNDSDDKLFTLSEMERADETLKRVYAKAGALDRYCCNFYPGPHKFDLEMQADAFDWFGRWLRDI